MCVSLVSLFECGMVTKDDEKENQRKGRQKKENVKQSLMLNLVNHGVSRKGQQIKPNRARIIHGIVHSPRMPIPILSWEMPLCIGSHAIPMVADQYSGK